MKKIGLSLITSLILTGNLYSGNYDFGCNSDNDVTVAEIKQHENGSKEQKILMEERSTFLENEKPKLEKLKKAMKCATYEAEFNKNYTTDYKDQKSSIAIYLMLQELKKQSPADQIIHELKNHQIPDLKSWGVSGLYGYEIRLITKGLVINLLTLNGLKKIETSSDSYKGKDGVGIDGNKIIVRTNNKSYSLSPDSKYRNQLAKEIADALALKEIIFLKSKPIPMNNEDEKEANANQSVSIGADPKLVANTNSADMHTHFNGKRSYIDTEIKREESANPFSANVFTETMKVQFGTSDYDVANSITTDKDGNIYITGSTNGALSGSNAGSYDIWVAKYNSSGTQAWIKQFGTSNYDYARGITTDKDANIYITGYTSGALSGSNAGSYDIWVAKYNSSGTQAWIKQFGTSDRDIANSITTDKDGNIYITGYTGGALSGSNAGDYDIWVAKYNSSGTQAWIKQFGTSVHNGANSITTDKDGNIYITGPTGVALNGSNSGSDDIWVAKYNSSGTQAWIKQFGTSDRDVASGITTDKDGNIYITGPTSGALSGSNAGSYDIWVAKYNSSGIQAWIKQFGTSTDDYSTGITTDKDGNIYITGFTSGAFSGSNSSDYDIWVAKYNSSGTQAWIKQFGTSDNDWATGITTDKDGDIYITGSTEGALSGSNSGHSDIFILGYQVNVEIKREESANKTGVSFNFKPDESFADERKQSNFIAKFAVVSKETKDFGTAHVDRILESLDSSLTNPLTQGIIRFSNPEFVKKIVDSSEMNADTKGYLLYALAKAESKVDDIKDFKGGINEKQARVTYRSNFNDSVNVLKNARQSVSQYSKLFIKPDPDMTFMEKAEEFLSGDRAKRKNELRELFTDPYEAIKALDLLEKVPPEKSIHRTIRN
jgi:uncharacterized delta-60 repeat protein